MAGLAFSIALALVAALLGVAAGARRRWTALFFCGLACQAACWNAALMLTGAEVILL